MTRTRRIVSTTLAAGVLALGLTASSQAQADRYGDPRQPAYGYPEVSPERIAGLAHELEQLATETHRRAERNNRRPDSAEARVLSELHALEERAEHFHDQVERYRRDLRHLRGDFSALEESFYGVASSLRYIRPRDYIDRRMDRMDALIDEIGRSLGSPRGYGHWRNRGERRSGDHDGFYDPYRDDRDRSERDDDRWRDRDRDDDDHDDHDDDRD